MSKDKVLKLNDYVKTRIATSNIGIYYASLTETAISVYCKNTDTEYSFTYENEIERDCDLARLDEVML